MKSLIRKLVFAMGMGKLYGLAADIKSRFFYFAHRLQNRLDYWRVKQRIRHYPRSQKIRVLFWVSEPAKWKVQSLYNIMRASKDFDPYVVLGVPKDDLRLGLNGLQRKIEEDRRFYEKLGCKCIVNFQFDVMRPHPLREFRPDIVFYQDPRHFFEEDSLEWASKSALCCYVPYSIETFGLIWIHILPWFHELLYLRVAPTKTDERYIKTFMPWWRRAGRIKGLGHTVFDEYLLDSSCEEPSNYVIYAPHFSFPTDKKERPIVISTFLKTGRPILEYAKAHQEIKWLFKPHPLLRRELELLGAWSHAEIEEYYSDWENLGATAYQGDYVRLFKESQALITDCSSFLVEYALTKKPVIRLIPKEINVNTRPAYASLFASYYTVHSLDEMYSAFAIVLEHRKDPKKEDRLKAVQSLGLIGKKASAEQIISILLKTCGRR